MVTLRDARDHDTMMEQAVRRRLQPGYSLLSPHYILDIFMWDMYTHLMA